VLAVSTGDEDKEGKTEDGSMCLAEMLYTAICEGCLPAFNKLGIAGVEGRDRPRVLVERGTVPWRQALFRGELSTSSSEIACLQLG